MNHSILDATVSFNWSKSLQMLQLSNEKQARNRYPIPKKVKALFLKRTGRTPSKTDSGVVTNIKVFREKMSLNLASQLHHHLFLVDSVILPFPCTLRGHSYCKRPGPKLVVVPVDVRHRIFITHEIIIHTGSRCPYHLQQNIKDMNPISSSKCLNRQSIVQLLKLLRYEVMRIERTRLNFKSPSQFHWLCKA